MRLLTLTENETTSAVELTVEQRDLLQQLVPSISIAPSQGLTSCYNLTPDRDIGGVQLGDDLAVEIRPKVPIGHVLFMLSYALGNRKAVHEPFDFGRDATVIEAVIPSFVAHVERAFRPGVLQGYRPEEDSLTTVRGRIRFGEQIQKRFNIAPPIEVGFDEFTEDVHENRVIKAAIAHLGRMRIRDDSLRASLRRFGSVLGTVQFTSYNPRQLPNITYTRLNERYRPAVELAKIILQKGAFELKHGTVHGSAVLFDMAKVVEDFIVVALRDALGATRRTLFQGRPQQPLYLDTQDTISLEPDLSWWEAGRCRFVGDVKYKLLKNAKGQNPDLYQLLAYTVATQLSGGLLIYAAKDARAARHQVRFFGKVLEIATVDLGGSPKEILEEVRAVAAQIRSLSRAAA